MLRVNSDELPVASSETARHINRRTILNLIRNRQPISRADLARFSGLQRSTVSLIIEELIEDRWVVEGATGRLPRGRRPTFLSLNPERAIICIDIRSSRITLAVSDAKGVFSSEDIFRTPSDPELAINELLKRIRPLLDRNSRLSFEGIGVSLPGRINATTQRLVFAPNLHWPATDIKSRLEEETGLTVVLENAANACALYEMWFGHSNFRNLVAITVSEGIGTGIIADGRLLRSTSGMAGEFGHVPLELEGPMCSCGNQGCWETLASNSAAVRYYRQAKSVESSAQQNGFEFQDLLALAGKNDSLAVKALDMMAVQLARGVRMIVAGLAPEAVVFVGEFTSAWSRFEPRLQENINRKSLSADPVSLIASPDGAQSRLLGAVALVLNKDFGITLHG